ncbi:WD40 repeat domain-containing protein [Mucilaginibacter pallidiroseus]|uniref:WD40 repeat domain-containing protein n=1 Tax=Mucilaginibacter pallidiroseus TaxID=2599295 RepID=A0A563UCC4_9SPHI|nr:WD40 repeat domain-containing protein [Mucilaginibacter pallidiroseus]TWR29028.1 WD40 repeat domain-containing protein [Mucilaginibacter pallidiroseus]
MLTVQKTAELTGHANPIFSIELSQKPGILFSGGNDKGLVEWNINDNTFIKVMFPVPTSVYAIHCPEGYPLMFAGLRNGEVLVFNFIEQKITHRLRKHIKPVFDIKSSAKKDELLVASEDGTVSIWSLQTMDLLHSIKVSDDTVRCIAINPAQNRVAFGCRDSRVMVYDLNDYSPIKALIGHTMAVFSAQYSPDGQYLLTGSRDAQLKVWDANDYELIKNIPAHMFAINHILFHPTQPYFATASMDKSIKIWGAYDFKLYKIISREKGYPSHMLSVNKLTWVDNQLLSTSDDKSIIKWAITF